MKKLEVIGKAKGTGTLHHLQARRRDLQRDHCLQVADPHRPAPPRTRLPQFAAWKSSSRTSVPPTPKPERSSYTRRRRGVREADQHKARPRCTRSRSASPRKLKLHARRQARPRSTCEVVLQYNDTYNDQVLCYTNTHPQPRTAARISPASAAPSPARSTSSPRPTTSSRIKTRRSPATTSARVSPLSSRSSTATRSSNPRPRSNSSPLRSRASSAPLTYEGLMQYFEMNPPVAKRIVEKALNGRPRPRGRPQGPRDASARAPSPAAASRQARRLLRDAIPRSPNSTSSRATPPAAPPNRAATAASRRSSRSAASSSTPRKPASTRFWPTRKSAP